MKKLKPLKTTTERTIMAHILLGENLVHLGQNDGSHLRHLHVSDLSTKFYKHANSIIHSIIDKHKYRY